MKFKMKQKNRDYLLFAIMAFFIVSLIIISGCTGLNLSRHESVSAAATATAATEILPSSSEAASDKLFEPVKLPGPGLGKEEYFAKPEYDPETEEKIISEAKAEILRVFPKTETSSVNKYHWDSELAGGFFVPVIVFGNVIVDTDDPENFCSRIYYDPEKRRIVLWEYDRNAPVMDQSRGEIIRHEDIDIDTDIIPVFKQMIGDEKYEKNKENYFIYLFDSQNTPMTTVAHIVEGSGGAKSYMGEVRISINRASGKAIIYSDRFNSEEFFKKAFTLSPTPKITLDEAKSILEAKIDELNPGEPQNIEYAKGVSAENTGGLVWLDSSTYLNIEGDYLLSPVPLAWGILYITEETRGWGGSGRIWAAIDANDGEILSFYNERIDISGKSYD